MTNVLTTTVRRRSGPDQVGWGAATECVERSRCATRRRHQGTASGDAHDRPLIDGHLRGRVGGVIAFRWSGGGRLGCVWRGGSEGHLVVL